MDKYLTDYLNSGKAWVLVGSGPSLQMGYPSWEELARNTVTWVRTELLNRDTHALDSALARRDWPRVFEEASRLLGDERRLLQYLDTQLKPKDRRGEIYDLIARWPVTVYLTTNWDDEIQRHLTQLGETYIPYSNSADHIAHLTSDLQGAIFKLHGDLRSTSGLVMTSNEYEGIAERQEWEHWRSKMSAVFQMSRMVVIGHSLTDPHIRHVLEYAKRGAGIERPVVWIAPDADDDLRREMLLQHRIRVVTYFNRDGKHGDLLHLLRDITRFVVPRERIAIHQDLVRAMPSSSQSESAAAAALLVYSKVAESDPLEKKRTKLIVAALESAVPDLASRASFTLAEALKMAGWPDECPLSSASAEEVAREAEEQGLFARLADGRFGIATKAVPRVREHIDAYAHLRERFQRSLAQRINRLFLLLPATEASQLATDIDRALIGSFRADGFALASSTFAVRTRTQRILPGSIMDFLNNASAQYPDLLHRRAFFSSVVDMLVNPGTADIQYLGSLAGGYCAFNYLGVYGDVAIQRLQHAKDTVWLLDSNVQIPTLALASPTHNAFSSCIERLRQAQVRLFTLESLFEETFRHYQFATGIVNRYGPASSEVLYGAQGQPPFRKTNQFLGGFVRWQSAGNPPDWEAYLSAAINSRNPDRTAMRSKLESLGITVVDIEAWPGFSQTLFEERDRLTQAVVSLRPTLPEQESSDDLGFDFPSDPQRKAKPEAEALIVVQKERSGIFYILSGTPRHSEGWFISHTTILNSLCEEGSRVTWKPESFLRFTEGLPAIATEPARADRMFETLLWSVAQSGLNLLDQDTADAVFGSAGDQCVLNVAQERERYAHVLEEKYTAAPDKVLEKVPRADQPLAALQLANELAQMEKARADSIARESAELKKRLKEANRDLARVSRYRKRAAEKAAKGKRKARRQASKPKRKNNR